MAKTPSNMLALGTKAPSFSLLDTISGETMTFENVRGPKGTVVMFICNHCPFVIHVQDELVSFAKDYMGQGIGVVAISANDVENYPEDSPEKMKKMGRRHSYPFPYLYDESQEVAQSYEAACTPDFYFFDENDSLIYRGQFDASRPGGGVPVTGEDLRAACDAHLAGTPVSADQKPSVGCNIKWR